MARVDAASAVRAPSVLRASRAGGSSSEAGEGDDGRPKLRLVVTRGRLAIELAEPFSLGAIEVRELTLSLPDVTFPVDLSGGVQAFRNRRGVLERLVVGISGDPRACSRDLAAPFGGERPEVSLGPTTDGFSVGARGGAAALAFEVIVVSSAEDIRLIPVDVRALGLESAPQAVALAMVMAATAPHGRLLGGAVVVERVARLVVEELLPLSGLRAPATDGVCWSEPSPELGALRLVATDETLSDPSVRALRSVEAAALAADGDDALSRGRLDEARHAYLSALERAPRHRELVRRVAALDRVAGRPSVALGVLADLGIDADADVLSGDLLELQGDRDGARVAFERAAETEPYGSLAALSWARVAQLSSGEDSLAALDRAVSLAPTWSELRWRRFAARLKHGELADALADAGELEVAARGTEQRHAVARRVADALMGARHLEAASRWFDRALRFRPDGPDALAGLARSLDALGQSRRALELHLRAVGLDRERRGGNGRARPVLVLDLARALVTHTDDRPAAIAHVRSIPPQLPESFEARLLEGRWRAELGDTAGASEAFARLGDEVERSLGALVGDLEASPPPMFGGAHPTRRDVANAVASHLEEAARVEEFDRGDRLAARRLLSLALRLAPRRASIRASFRRVADEGLQPLGGLAVPSTLEVLPGSVSGESGAPSADAPVETPAELASGDDGTLSDDARVEALTERLRANPGDFLMVGELADVLERLGRDHELLALLSARIDEESGPRRGILVSRRNVVLDRLKASALAEGRRDEADLYELLTRRD